MGNSKDGSYGKEESWYRAEKNVAYRLKDGDMIGILMKKDSNNREMILGFEYMENKESRG